MTTRFLMCTLTVCGFIQAQASAYSGGQGTIASPYLLSSKEDIIELASRPSDYDKSFIVTEDIDLEGAVFDGPVIAPDIFFAPSFGEYDGLFTGGFNGNGHVIENFSIVGEGLLGFFGGIGRGGRVMHLGLENATVQGPDASNAGMLAAINMGDIVGCYAQGYVAGRGNAGGLVGYQYKGCVIACFSRGFAKSVVGSVGGLVGVLAEGEVRHCYAAVVTLSEDYSSDGGLVGMPVSGGRGSPPCVVSNCFWDIDVSGLSVSRGGVGLSTEQMCDVSNYMGAKWDFTAEQSNGINDIWTVSDEGGYPTLSAFSGIEPVWLSGDGTSDDPYRLSTARELAAMVYYNGGRYFDLEVDIDLSGILWSVPVVAEFNGHLDGCGHGVRGFCQEGSCGLFDTIEEGSTVTNLHLEETEIRAGEGPVGSLAGENHGCIMASSVTGIVMGGTVTGGLVGYNEGDIMGCSFWGVTMGEEHVGGLVGENAATIINSLSRGAVSGDGELGGLAGSNHGLVRSCYSLASVAGGPKLGGLVGVNSGSVADSYARGSVGDAYCTGGLVGHNKQEVSRCYGTGSVGGQIGAGGLIGCGEPETGVVSDSFWDKETSGRRISAGGVGIESYRMKDVDTFLNAGWDFVGETANGTEDLWTIGHDGYPDLTLSLILSPGPSRGTR